MRTRCDRRHNNWREALRKRNIIRNVHKLPDLYDNLHQYSDNKVHCSCPICRGKTRNKQIAGPAELWPPHDARRFEDMKQQVEEYNEG